MHNPPHPGEIVRAECLDPLGLTDVVNGRAGISVDMALRLSKAFGSSPETWLRMQVAHDLWQARDRADALTVERFAPA